MVNGRDGTVSLQVTAAAKGCIFWTGMSVLLICQLVLVCYSVLIQAQHVAALCDKCNDCQDSVDCLLYYLYKHIYYSSLQYNGGALDGYQGLNV